MIYLIRGGSGQGKTTLAENIASTLSGEWDYFNFVSGEELAKLNTVIISTDFVYEQIWGQPVLTEILDDYDNLMTYLEHLMFYIDICINLKKNIIIEGVTLYWGREYLEKELTKQDHVWSIECHKFNNYFQIVRKIS